MTKTHLPFRRAQLYAFLAGALLYPAENWLEDIPDLGPIVSDLSLDGGPLPALDLVLPSWELDLPALQAEHRRAFGLTGSLCYEAEYGLPNEFRLSQELADIAGFYRAFGFEVGGPLRERPDHLAMELEFLYVLALKEAYALQRGRPDQVDVCQQAQAKFIQDHPGRWVSLFAASLAASLASAGADSPYLWLAKLAEHFVCQEALRLGVTPETRALVEVQHTPVVTDISCGDCPLS